MQQPAGPRGRLGEIIPIYTSEAVGTSTHTTLSCCGAMAVRGGNRQRTDTEWDLTQVPAPGVCRSAPPPWEATSPGGPRCLPGTPGATYRAITSHVGIDDLDPTAGFVAGRWRCWGRQPRAPHPRAR